MKTNTGELKPFDTLKQTKLHRPRPTRYLVVRQRLWERLDKGMAHSLILVSAPAGYGKTTLVSSWIENMQAGDKQGSACMPVTWLSLDQYDSDEMQFLEYLVGALQKIFDSACMKTLELIQSPQRPPLNVITTSLINEIDQFPNRFILVLDDYQNIQGQTVHNLLDELLGHSSPLLHLVLISRVDPPLSLPRLRANGMLTEIRSRDLRFSKEEADAFLAETLEFSLNSAVLTQLEERLEGWIAGLRLAALSLRVAGEVNTALTTMASLDSNTTDYLVDEVLARQLPAIQTFLLKTSILDRFCASLCEAVIGKVDSAWSVRACLDWIERSELFITPLDNQREWYRFHQLFQELLRQRLSAELTPDQVKVLHHQASFWFEEHGLLDEGLQHALAAGDLDLAARQMTVGLRDVINREDRPTLERWLHLLPEEMISRRPGLLMVKAWALQNMWRLDLQAQVLQQVEELLEADEDASLPLEDLPILHGQILVLKSQTAYFTNNPSLAIDQCQQALAHLPPAWEFARGGAMFYLGMSMQAVGQGLEAERLLLDAYESCNNKASSYAQLVLQALGWNYLKTGQLERTRQIGQVMLNLGTDDSIAINKSLGGLFRGVAEYQQNALETAARLFTQIVNNRYTAHITAYRDAVAGLTLIHQFNGEIFEARQMVELISQFDLEQSGIEDPRTRSLRARLMFMQGDLEGASRWVDSFTNLPPDQALLWLEEPQVTRARILLARGGDSDLHKALQVLDTLEEIAERTHNTRHKIEIMALRTLALDAQGKTRKAETVLQQALDLAQPGGHIRVFVDLGKPMQEVLQRLEERSPSKEYIQRLLAAFKDELQKKKADYPQRATAPSAALNQPVLAEPLTARELDVLTLLREPLSNKDIASKLYLSPSTVKRHTINLYGKLGVHSRREAVAVATNLGILPPA